MEKIWLGERGTILGRQASYLDFCNFNYGRPTVSKLEDAINIVCMIMYTGIGNKSLLEYRVCILLIQKKYTE